MCQQSTGRCSYLGNTPVSLFTCVDGDIGCKYILGISQGCSLGSDLQFHAHASLFQEFCRPPSTYVHASRAGLLPSTRRKERLALRNSYQDILNYLDFTCMYGAGLLGSVVGDMALLYGVQGGVYLAGGILPKIRDFLIGSSFVPRFLNKGSMREALERIPVKLVEHGQLGVVGAAKWYLEQHQDD